MKLWMVMSLLAATSLRAQGTDFDWHGRLDAGQELVVRGVHGDIQVLRATGREARVTAVKDARRSDPEAVEIEVVPYSGGVTICAVYPSPRRRGPNECLPGGEGRMNTEDNDVEVSFTVYVPDGVKLVAKTVSGDVDVDRVNADVVAESVNGSVRLSTSGVAQASTVNGSVTAEMGRVDWTGSLAFESVNGSIPLTFPVGLSTDLRAETVNGSIESDFPLTVQGRFSHRELRGVIGNGGRDLDLETVNGSIRLRRAP